jgi:hypothetical protein
MEALYEIKKKGRNLAGVVIILLALESEGMFFNLAMGKMIEMTDEEMSRVYFVVNCLRFLTLLQ